VSRYEKGKNQSGFTGAIDSEWQWHHLAICNLHMAQTGNHASTPISVFTGRMPFLPPNQQCQSTEGTCNYFLEDRINANPAITTS